MNASPLLGPIVALVAWTTVYNIATSLRRKAPDADSPAAPNPYRAVMLEQPVRFYAITFVLVLIHGDWPLNVWIAWTYVGLRVARDLVEATVDHAPSRFYLFIGATICLAALIVHAAMGLILS